MCFSVEQLGFKKELAELQTMPLALEEKTVNWRCKLYEIAMQTKSGLHLKAKYQPK